MELTVIHAVAGIVKRPSLSGLPCLSFSSYQSLVVTGFHGSEARVALAIARQAFRYRLTLQRRRRLPEPIHLNTVISPGLPVLG